MAATDRYAYAGMAICLVTTIFLVWSGTPWLTCLVVSAIGFGAYAVISLVGGAIVLAPIRNAKARGTVFPFIGIGISAATGIFPAGLIAAAIQGIRAAL